MSQPGPNNDTGTTGGGGASALRKRVAGWLHVRTMTREASKERRTNMYTVTETNAAPTRETIISTASWAEAFSEAAHIATATGTEWREIYEGDDIVLRVDAGDDVELLDAWGVLGKRAASERWSLERCKVAADARVRIAEGLGGAALWCAALFGEVDRDAVQCVARDGVQGESAAVARWRANQAKLEFLLD